MNYYLLMNLLEYIPVILCGGSGSRLYPLSRDNLPKQFLRLTNEYSLLQNTILKFRDRTEIYLVSNKKHEYILCNQINELYEKNLLDKKTTINIVMESYGRNTAPAVTLMCNHFTERNLLFLPCDHIYDQMVLLNAVKEGLEQNNSITTFGIQIKSPETGFGYLMIDDNNNNKIKRFVEKPTYEIALEYFKSGKYLWNSGMFLMKSRDVREMLQHYLPKTSHIVSDIEYDLNRISDNIVIFYINDKYQECENISIDYALMEKLPESTIGLVKYNGVWDDIGSFSSLVDIDNKGNDNILSINSSGCYIHSDKLVLLNSVTNLAVIETEDVLLVSDLDKSQDVKKLYELTKTYNRKEIEYTTKLYNSWGFIENINRDDKCTIKKITIYPDNTTTIYINKNNSYTCLDGEGEVIINSVNSKEQQCISKGDIIRGDNDKYIEIKNTCIKNLVVVEISILIS